MKVFLLVAIGIAPALIFSQKCDKVLFTGKVVDSLRPQTFYNLMLVNKRTGQGVFGQPNGSFSIYVASGDTVLVSVKGYVAHIEVVIPDSNCQYRKRITIDPKPRDLKEIKVKPLRSLEEIREEREALAMRETRMVTGLEVLQSPITALYQAFSKKERNKRWIAEQEFKDDQRKIVKELLRLYVSYDIINLNEDQFDEFIYFLNVSDEFLKTASEMELIIYIKDKFEHYQEIKSSEQE